MACPGRKQCIKFEIRTACRELRFSCHMYELCAQDDELWTISAVRASFADDRRIQYAIWNYCSENCAGSKFAATMWDFKSNWDNLEFRTAVQDPICNECPETSGGGKCYTLRRVRQEMRSPESQALLTLQRVFSRYLRRVKMHPEAA